MQGSVKRLFRYAVLLHPTEDEKKEGKSTETIIEPTEYALFTSQDECRMKAFREVPEEYLQASERLEVAVHPFC